MIKDVFESIGTAARKMLTNWGAILISFALYAALLAVLYFFFTTREATTAQVLLSVLLAIASIVFFFLLQAMGLSYVRIGVGPAYLLKRALRDCWKLLLLSIPLLLLAWLIIYLFTKVGATFFSDTLTVESPWRSRLSVVIDWARIFLLYFALPLIAIHFWIAAVREGVKESFKGAGRNIARALAPRSVLIYFLVIALFGVIAYFLFFTLTPVGNVWAELWLFGARLAAGLLFVFVGWLLTLGSLAELTARRALGELEV
jgi:hypothetical protein